MTGTSLALSIAIALLAGFALGWLVAALRAQRNEKRLSVDLEVARTQLQSQAALEAERGATIEHAQERLKSAFDSLANASLRSNSELFLKLARENLGQQQLQAQHSLKEREQAIESLLGPIRDALKRTEEQISTIEKDRHEAFGAIRQHLESVNVSQSALQRETRNLVNALRKPEVRGQWGELSLRRLVELAGMTAHCDFTEQVHTPTEDGALRPDLIVHMVDDRDLVVDVKTPLTAYLEAVEAQSDEARAAALRRHGQLVAERVRALSSKAYWAQFTRSPDFVILFLPGDQFLAAANQTGKPRGLRWVDCEFGDGYELARDRATGQLIALVPVTVSFEAIEGGSMEGVEAVGKLRNATAVFTFARGHWTTAGKAVFNLNPDETLVHFKSQYERVEKH